MLGHRRPALIFSGSKAVTSQADVIIIGGGHNGLVAAAYLAQAGKSVLVCEAQDRLGGAVASEMIFPGVPARLSRFSYLVSLLPDKIINDLRLPIELRSRSVASYSPYAADGLLVERPEGAATEESFRRLTGGDQDHRGWRDFYARWETFARVLAPTLTGPLPQAAELRCQIEDEWWRAITMRPIGELIEASVQHDVVRGTVLTDALIGTESWAHDDQLRQNRCFLYHLVGGGTGEWKVPVGGMGSVSGSLVQAAEQSGATLLTQAAVTGLDGGPHGWRVELADGRTLSARTVLANCAQAEVDRLLGRSQGHPEGNQLKINMVLRRLPRLRSGLDPRIGFAGTLHVNQGYRQLAAAHEAAVAGRLPDLLPCEVYCHTLSDDSILAPRLRADGWQTLTLFGLHTPASLFTPDPVNPDPDGARDRATAAALASLQSVLAEPLEDCLARHADGELCLETMTPLDVEAAIGMPGGHIFHGDLSWPWLDDDEAASSPAQRWGCDTDLPGLLMCGSSSRRGGAVSGLGGHSAAMAVLEADQR